MWVASLVKRNAGDTILVRKSDSAVQKRAQEAATWCCAEPKRSRVNKTPKNTKLASGRMFLELRRNGSSAMLLQRANFSSRRSKPQLRRALPDILKVAVNSAILVPRSEDRQLAPCASTVLPCRHCSEWAGHAPPALGSASALRSRTPATVRTPWPMPTRGPRSKNISAPPCLHHFPIKITSGPSIPN